MHLYSVGRQTHHGGLFPASCKGWQPEMESFEGNRRTRQQSKVVTGALPTEVSAAATALAVGGALFALTKLNKDTEAVRPAKTVRRVLCSAHYCRRFMHVVIFTLIQMFAARSREIS